MFKKKHSNNRRKALVGISLGLLLMLLAVALSFASLIEYNKRYIEKNVIIVPPNITEEIYIDPPKVPKEGLLVNTTASFKLFANSSIYTSIFLEEFSFENSNVSMFRELLWRGIIKEPICLKINVSSVHILPVLILEVCNNLTSNCYVKVEYEYTIHLIIRPFAMYSLIAAVLSLGGCILSFAYLLKLFTTTNAES